MILAAKAVMAFAACLTFKGSSSWGPKVPEPCCGPMIPCFPHHESGTLCLLPLFFQEFDLLCSGRSGVGLKNLTLVGRPFARPITSVSAMCYSPSVAVSPTLGPASRQIWRIALLLNRPDVMGFAWLLGVYPVSPKGFGMPDSDQLAPGITARALDRASTHWTPYEFNGSGRGYLGGG